jgi:hypothetical protein
LNFHYSPIEFFFLNVGKATRLWFPFAALFKIEEEKRGQTIYFGGMTFTGELDDAKLFLAIKRLVGELIVVIFAKLSLSPSSSKLGWVSCIFEISKTRPPTRPPGRPPGQVVK